MVKKKKWGRWEVEDRGQRVDQSSKYCSSRSKESIQQIQWEKIYEIVKRSDLDLDCIGTLVL
jgi:hypothetical protein